MRNQRYCKKIKVAQRGGILGPRCIITPWVAGSDGSGFQAALH